MGHIPKMLIHAVEYLFYDWTFFAHHRFTSTEAENSRARNYFFNAVISRSLSMVMTVEEDNWTISQGINV